MAEHYDVIIIGTGAGGGTLAHTLAPSGKRILLLERGDFLPREKENWDAEAVFVKGRYISPDSWKDKDGEPFQPGVHYYVGGATKLYGAALYRLRPGDFGELTHVDGVSPAWPVSYEDFEPWYTKAEWLYQVHGTPRRGPDRGCLEPPVPAPARQPRAPHQADPRRPGEGRLPPVQRALRHPPRRGQPGRPALASAAPGATATRASCRPRRTPRPSPSSRRLQHPNVTLLVDTEVTRLQTDAAGRTVTGVVTQHGGAEEIFEADIVVVSAGATNSSRSSCPRSSDAHPNGLANGSDQVGRNYMYHNSKAVVALGKEPNETAFQKTLGLNDFYFGGPDFDYPLGNIQMVGKSNAEAMKGEEPHLTLLAPHWSLADVAAHAVDFWLTTEDLPRPENRVTLDGDGTVRLAYTATNDDEAERLYEELKKILNHVGMAQHHVLGKNFYMSMDIPVAGVAHQAGTCRFGTDPQTSVLDVNCKAHEVDNLYVVDTSFFPSIGAVNPALTAMANAIRVGEHLTERLA